MDVKQVVRKKLIEPESSDPRAQNLRYDQAPMAPAAAFRKLRWPLTLVALLGLAGLVWLLANWRGESPSAHVPQPAPDTVAALTEAGAVVTLSPEKISASSIQVAEAQHVDLQSTKTLPGRLVYNPERHVDVKSACEGILVDLPLRPGQPVKAGQTVAVVNSPEVGRARALVRAHAAADDLARNKLNWLRDVDQGVQQLVRMIRAADSPDSIESQLARESLGRYRERLVEPYTRSLLARQVAGSSREAAAAGAIPGRIQKERERELQAARASLESALEQSLFDARQEHDQARAEWQQARERLAVSGQQLSALLGPVNEQVTEPSAETGASTVLSQVRLRAPLDGTLESRALAVGERIAAGQTIVTVADTSRLWVEADVRQGDWAAMDVQPGRQVLVYTPAIPGEKFQADVVVVGRFMDAASGAVPLTSCLTQYDARLRPGMFVRVEVPYGASRSAVTVADSAVVVHDGKSFVFLRTGPTTFRRVDVEPGEAQEHRVEIRHGLQPGDPVVVQGAFQLKSELLLAGERE